MTHVIPQDADTDASPSGARPHPVQPARPAGDTAVPQATGAAGDETAAAEASALPQSDDGPVPDPVDGPVPDPVVRAAPDRGDASAPDGTDGGSAPDAPTSAESGSDVVPAGDTAAPLSLGGEVGVTAHGDPVGDATAPVSSGGDAPAVPAAPRARIVRVEVGAPAVPAARPYVRGVRLVEVAAADVPPPELPAVQPVELPLKPVRPSASVEESQP